MRSPTSLSLASRFTWACVLAVAGCASMMAFALFEQYGRGLDPCHLCILQRIGIILCGLGFAGAALHRPTRTGKLIYVGCSALGALFALIAACRNVWVQMQPEGSIPGCTADLNVLIQMMPLHTALMKLFWSGGDCHDVAWSLFGFSMAAWVALCACLLLLWSCLCGYWAIKAPRAT